MSKYYFDGYSVGDRVLEGCYFIITWDDENNEILKVESHPSNDKYFDQAGINGDLWCKRIKEHLEVCIEDDGYTLQDLIDEEFTEEAYVKTSYRI